MEDLQKLNNRENLFYGEDFDEGNYTDEFANGEDCLARQFEDVDSSRMLDIISNGYLGNSEYIADLIKVVEQSGGEILFSGYTQIGKYVEENIDSIYIYNTYSDDMRKIIKKLNISEVEDYFDDEEYICVMLALPNFRG